MTVLAVGLNFTLNYVLVFGLFGFPALGVAGVGYSTGIISWMMLGALVLQIFASPPLGKYQVFSQLRKLELSQCWEILRLGLPAAGTIILEAGMFSVISILMGILSAEDLAANQIVLTFVDTVTVMAVAIGEAATIRVAQELGRGKLHKAYNAGYTAISLGTVFMASMAVIMWLLPKLIVSIFLDVNDPANTQVLNLAITLFGIAAIFQIFDGIQSITTRVLKGFKDTVAPMWIGAVGYWLVAVMGGYVLSFPLKMGGSGLWWGLAGGLTATASLLIWRLHSFRQTNLALEKLKG